MENTGLDSRRIRHIPYGVRFAVKQLTSLAMGCLLAKTRLFEGLPSLAVAFVAAVPTGCVTASTIGAMIGSIVFADELLPGLMGAAAVLACGMIGFSLRTLTRTRENPLSAFFVAFLCCVAAGMTTLLARGFYFSGVLLFLCDGVLAGGAAYFFVRAMTLWNVLRRPAVLDNTEVLSLMAGACAVLLSFASFQIYVFVPARLIAVGVILLSAFLFSETGGGAAGILCGTAMELVCGVRGVACVYAVGGLLGGLLSKKRHWLLPLAMTAVSGILPLVTRENGAVAVFTEAALACALFCVVPKRTLVGLRRMFSASRSTSEMDASADRRLFAAARAVSEITPYLAEQQLRQGKIPGTKYMTRRVQELVCADCNRKEQCWKSDMEKTTLALEDCFSFLHRKAYLSCEDLPKLLEENCVRRNMLSAACVQAYEENAQSPYGQSSAVEWASADPFTMASELLSDVAQQCADEGQYLQKESARAGQVLREYGLVVHEVSCVRQNGRYSLRVVTDAFSRELNKTALTAELSRACGCVFALPSIEVKQEEYQWSFAQTTRYRLRTGTAQHAADGHACGDYFVTFEQNGRQYFVLCDGMGTGESAWADAQTAAEIFASLLRANLSFDCALRTVNEALLMREDAESVSTLDVACVDLFTGEAEFCKAGAAATYLLHRGKVECVDTPGMPIGILSDTHFAHTKRMLEKGDVFVMVSDGTCALSDGHIHKSLQAFKGGSAQSAAEQILYASRKRGQKNREDDSTVLCIVVE